MPIEQRIKWTGESGPRREKRTESEAVKRVIRWNEESEQEFKKKLAEQGQSTSWTDLKEKIRRAIPWAEVRGSKDKIEEKWWDTECHERKRELRESLRKLKRGEIEEKDWRSRRREYRYFIEGKKRSRDKEWLEEVEKDKGMKLFWKAVGAGKKKGATIVKSITKEQWKEHFRGQYIIGETEECMMTERKKNEQEEKMELQEITETEITETIRKLKKRKRRKDGITNEAWMIGENELREDLRNIFNEIWKGGEIPKEWKIGTIKPIHKKGDKKEVGNYRGITLMDTGYKIYAEIVRKRLEKELTEKKVRIYMGYFSRSQQLKIFLHLVFYEKNMFLKF